MNHWKSTWPDLKKGEHEGDQGDLFHCVLGNDKTSHRTHPFSPQAATRTVSRPSAYSTGPSLGLQYMPYKLINRGKSVGWASAHAEPVRTMTPHGLKPSLPAPAQATNHEIQDTNNEIRAGFRLKNRETVYLFRALPSTRRVNPGGRLARFQPAYLTRSCCCAGPGICGPAPTRYLRIAGTDLPRGVPRIHAWARASPCKAGVRRPVHVCLRCKHVCRANRASQIRRALA